MRDDAILCAVALTLLVAVPANVAGAEVFLSTKTTALLLFASAAPIAMRGLQAIATRHEGRPWA